MPSAVLLKMELPRMALLVPRINHDAVLRVEGDDVARAGQDAADLIVAAGDQMPLPMLPSALCPVLSVPMRLPMT